MKLGSLFSGYGGLDMAVEEVFGASTAWVSDIDPGACKILAHRYPDLPNLGDVTAVDRSAVEPVDIICGGFPCQPVSHAGKRLGDQDERWLWDEFARAIRALRPHHVVVENVRGLLTAGHGRLFGQVLGDLAGLGYDARWHGIRAAEVGAPHGRFRIFVVASDADRSGRQGTQPTSRLHLSDRSPTPDAHGHALRQQPVPLAWGGGATVAGLARALATDALGERRDRRALVEVGRPQGRVALAGSGEDTASDADSDGLQGIGRVESERRDPDRRDRPDIDWGNYEPAIRRWEHTLQRPAPPPTEPGPRSGHRLNPRFVEWMMGLPEGWVCDVPGLSRNEQLKALGNGVVPQQAEAALRHLLGSDGEVAA